MKRHSTNQSTRRAFTLIELTLTMLLTMGIATALLSLIQQQIFLTTATSRHSFLRYESPQINTLLTNIISQADHYTIHNTQSDAKVGRRPKRIGNHVRLRFRHPNDIYEYAVISFQRRKNRNTLTYFHKGIHDRRWADGAKWIITEQPDQVKFNNEEGFLEITLTGPHGEEYTFSGNPM